VGDVDQLGKREKTRCKKAELAICLGIQDRGVRRGGVGRGGVKKTKELRTEDPMKETMAGWGRGGGNDICSGA